jgi:hypothetical protein
LQHFFQITFKNRHGTGEHEVDWIIEVLHDVAAPVAAAVIVPVMG